MRSGSAVLNLPLLALLGFVAVCGTVVYSVATPSLVPSLVSPQALPAANARIELARTVAFASGPALGGMLVGWIGAGPAFGFAAGLSIVAVVLLAGIFEPARQAIARRHPLQEIKEGAAFVFRHPLLRPVFVTQFIFNVAWFVILAVFVPYGRPPSRSLGGRHRHDAWRCMASAWWSARFRYARHAPPAVRQRDRPGAGDGFVASAMIALTTVFPTPLLAGLGFFLLGAGPILWVISTTTLRQSVTPPRLLGRVSAINIMSYGARPLGAGLGALVGGLFGAEACLYLAVAGFAVQMLVILMSQAVSLVGQPEMACD